MRRLYMDACPKDGSIPKVQRAHWENALSIAPSELLKVTKAKTIANLINP
jgi:hypothetical protein